MAGPAAAAAPPPPPAPPALAARMLAAGLRLRPEWLAQCCAGLAEAQPGFPALPLEQQSERVYLQALDADWNEAGAGGLPPLLGGGTPRGPLLGRFLLQVDEAVNIAAAYKERCAAQPSLARFSFLPRLARLYSCLHCFVS